MATKIKSFSKSNLSEVRRAIDEALVKVEKEYGISLKIGNISFTNEQFTTKLVSKITDPTVVLSVNSGLFEMYGLPANLAGQIVIHAGKQYQITGVDRGKRKFPITSTELSTGRTTSMTVDLVKLLIKLI
jgi:hypothetical protein